MKINKINKNMTHHSDYSKEPKRSIVQHHHTKLSYSPKMARAGHDIGKPGKNFNKIAASAGKRYGSAEAGRRVAGAILANLRAKGR